MNALSVFEEQDFPFQAGTSDHILMSRMMSMDEFLRHLRSNSAQTEVMLEPQEEWFEGNNYNYPVGIIAWAEKNVHRAITIYSSVFHQSNRNEDRLNQFSDKSGTVGFLSSIMISISFEDHQQSVRVEMTVGNDRLMLITKNSLILKSKYGNEVFEKWNREGNDDVSAWCRIHVKHVAKVDHVRNYPPVLLGKYSANIVSLLGLLIPKDVDALKNCEFATHLMLVALESDNTLKLNPDLKTPKELQDLYYGVVRQINEFREENQDLDATVRFVEATFENFRHSLAKYAMKNPTILTSSVK